MKITQGNIWQAPLPVLIAITTCSTILHDQELVMDAGIALTAKKKLPVLPFLACEIIQKVGPKYGFQVIAHPRTPGKAGLGIFQTKQHWANDSELDLINNSSQMLAAYARANADIPIRLNYPGIGLGRLDRHVVEPILIAHFSSIKNLEIYYV